MASKKKKTTKAAAPARTRAKPAPAKQKRRPAPHHGNREKHQERAGILTHLGFGHLEGN